MPDLRLKAFHTDPSKNVRRGEVDEVERLQHFDEAARSYSYSILQSPFPIGDYLATLRIKADGDGSLVEWFGELTPNGVSEAEVQALFKGIYEGGLEALAKTLG